MGFLEHLSDFDRLSFWLGFLGATLFWWLIFRFRPVLLAILDRIKEKRTNAQLGPLLVNQIRLRNNLLRFLQNLHIAAPLCPLDEILIPPLVLSPPIPISPGDPPVYEDIVTQTIPYIPDWPALGSTYDAHRMPVTTALSGGSNLVIIGPYGCGKTTALADLGIRLLRSESLPPNIENLTPIWLPALDLIAALPIYKSSLDILINTMIAGDLPSKNRAALLTQLLPGGKAVLLVDQGDEVSPAEFDLLVNFLQVMLTEYPGIRIVLTASENYIGDLLQLDFTPLGIVLWNQTQIHQFLDKWSSMWEKLPISPDLETFTADPALLRAWLSLHVYAASPFDWTLHTWQVFAGDSRGPRLRTAIKSYIMRLAFTPDGKEIPDLIPRLIPLALFQLKRGHLLDLDDTPAEKIFPTTTAESRIPGSNNSQRNLAEEASLENEETVSTVSHRDHFPDLSQGDLLRNHPGQQFTFIHPLVTAYLGSLGLDNGEIPSETVMDWLNDPVLWSMRTAALGFWMPSHAEKFQAFMQDEVKRNTSPTARSLFTLAHSLPWSNPGKWGQPIMRALSQYLQDPFQPEPMRARAITAIATSTYPNFEILLERMLAHSDPSTRLLGAFGAGMLSWNKAPQSLLGLLQDPAPMVRRASCLALVAGNTENGLEAVADAFVHGDDEIRQAAAEAFSLHPAEGHPTLLEGSRLDDFMVRRAAVYGLRRIPERWAIQRLEEMRLTDEQWVVKTAAAQVLDNLAIPDHFVPHPSPPLSEVPWLIAFASEQGEGISPGTADYVFERALRHGNMEQKLAAINYCQRRGDDRYLVILYQLLRSQENEVRAGAYQAIWFIEATGIQLPDPARYGLEQITH